MSIEEFTNIFDTLPGKCLKITGVDETTYINIVSVCNLTSNMFVLCGKLCYIYNNGNIECKPNATLYIQPIRNELPYEIITHDMFMSIILDNITDIVK